jgi:BirA family transcriptional regulator, biotin operon repressor / biotin---[acetyl-CoA-carboxylase] ligase
MMHPKPYLLGMAFALAIAEEFDLQVQWPNDLLLNGKKVAGLLTEIYARLPIIGIGLNLSQKSFPSEVDHRATSLVLAGRPELDPESAFRRILATLTAFEPVPDDWSDLYHRWLSRDRTEGKIFKLQDGRMGTAQGITNEGFLIWSDTVTEEIVPVAEALWGYSDL